MHERAGYDSARWHQRVLSASVRWMPEPSLNDEGIVWFANHIVAKMIQQSEPFNP